MPPTLTISVFDAFLSFSFCRDGVRNGGVNSFIGKGLLWWSRAAAGSRPAPFTFADSVKDSRVRRIAHCCNVLDDVQLGLLVFLRNLTSFWSSLVTFRCTSRRAEFLSLVLEVLLDVFAGLLRSPMNWRINTVRTALLPNNAALTLVM